MDIHACLECARACDGAVWGPSFEGSTFETEIVVLDGEQDAEFLAYLTNSDGGGVRLPRPPTTVKAIDPRASILRSSRELDGDSDAAPAEPPPRAARAAHNPANGVDSNHEDGDGGSESGSSMSSVSTFAAPLHALESRIENAIEQLGGSAFVKLNWTAPLDAVWVMEIGDLRVQSAGDVFLLLKSSDLVAYDLQLHQRLQQGLHATAAKPLALLLRKWHNLNPSGEFRCFVWEQQLVGISQRHTSELYSHLNEEATLRIRAAIWRFFGRRIRGRFPLRTFVFDVFVNSRDRVWLIDFAPFGGDTAPLLFDWEELAPPAPESASPAAERATEEEESSAPAAAPRCRLHDASPAAAAASPVCAGGEGSLERIPENGVESVPIRVVTDARMRFPPLAVHKFPEDLVRLAAERGHPAQGSWAAARQGGVEGLIDSLRERGLLGEPGEGQ